MAHWVPDFLSEYPWRGGHFAPTALPSLGSYGRLSQKYYGAYWGSNVPAVLTPLQRANAEKAAEILDLCHIWPGHDPAMRSLDTFPCARPAVDRCRNDRTRRYRRSRRRGDRHRDRLGLSVDCKAPNPRG
jgi:hypothetical protein